MNCKQCKSLFMEAFYSELEEPQQQAFEHHLADCEKCVKAFHNLQTTLQFMKQRQHAAPDPQFMDSLWVQIRPQLAQNTSTSATSPQQSRWRQRFFLPTPAPKWLIGFAGAAALFLLGILVGRTFLTSPPALPDFAGQQPVTSDDAQIRQIEQRSARYLDRSKVLLLGLINYETTEADSTILNLDFKKKMSRQLVQEAGVLRNELTDAHQLRLQKLIADIEMILLQIANLEETEDLPAIEMIRSSVDRKGIMLKINLEQMKKQSDAPALQNQSKNRSHL